MDAIEQETCVRFKTRTYESDYVNIYSGKYCKSNLGRTGGAQDLSLNTIKCFQKGIIIHELLHALGYIHMHSRPDRDKHVDVVWKNIDPRFFKDFDKVSPAMFNYYGTPYDYYSIMHYSPLAFSKNGKRTIIPRDKSFADAIGQRGGLSAGDIKRINTKYRCSADKPNKIFSTYGASYIKEKPKSNLRLYPIFKHKPKPLPQATKDNDDDDLFNI